MGTKRQVTENVNGNLNRKLDCGVNLGGTPVCLWVFQTVLQAEWEAQGIKCGMIKEALKKTPAHTGFQTKVPLFEAISINLWEALCCVYYKMQSTMTRIIGPCVPGLCITKALLLSPLSHQPGLVHLFIICQLGDSWVEEKGSKCVLLQMKGQISSIS